MASRRDIRPSIGDRSTPWTSLPKMQIEIVVRRPLGSDCRAIIQAARTGEIGDGRVFVIPVTHSYKIRTGRIGCITANLIEIKTRTNARGNRKHRDVAGHTHDGSIATADGPSITAPGWSCHCLTELVSSRGQSHDNAHPNQTDARSRGRRNGRAPSTHQPQKLRAR